MRSVFYLFWSNVRQIFSGKNLAWQILAWALTFVAVLSGFDWAYFVFFQTTTLQLYLFPAAIVGGLLPILLPVILYVIAKAKENLSLLNTTYAVTQAGVLGWLISSFYKVFTGRIEPPFLSGRLVDISHQFQFGFLRHGIFWGWPSSHATVACAMAATLYALYPKSWPIKASATIIAFYICFGVSTNIHWFSEAIAGAIIGSVIGLVVGGSFTQKTSV